MKICLPFRSRFRCQLRITCPTFPPSSRALHASPALNSRYRGIFKHGTLREWALRMQKKKIDRLFYYPRKPIPIEAKALMQRADKMVAQQLAKEAKLNRPADPELLEAADLLVKSTKRTGKQARMARTAEERDRDTAALREALRLYYLAGQHSNGMLPVLGSRILGVSNMLARRIFRTSDQLNEVLRTPPLAQRDEVGWGIREPEPESHPPQSPPDSNPPATYPPADPTAPSLYKRRTLPPLPPLPLSPAEHAALPLMRAFPGIGGGLPFSLQHALAAASGLLGSPIPPSAPPDLHVRPNPVVGVGEGQPRHVRSRPGARPFPTSAAGAPLNFFKRSPKRFPFMTPYYLSTPPPPPPLPPLDPAVARRPSLASALQKRLAGRVRH